MARVLFINAGSEGHINPTLQVVEELISRGEEVVYFSIEAFRNELRRQVLLYERLTIKIYKSVSIWRQKLFTGKNKRSSTYSRCCYT